MQKLRRPIVLVPSLALAFVLLLGGIRVFDGIVEPDYCESVYCPRVARGEMSWWYAFLIFGCWCDGGGQTESVKGKMAAHQPAQGPTCAAARIKVIGSPR